MVKRTMLLLSMIGLTVLIAKAVAPDVKRYMQISRM